MVDDVVVYIPVSDMAGNAMESVLETSSGSIAAEAQRIEEREERAMMTADFVQGELCCAVLCLRC